MQPLKLSSAIDWYRISIKGDTWPVAVFLVTERDKGDDNYKDHGIGWLWLSTIDF